MLVLCLVVFACLVFAHVYVEVMHWQEYVYIYICIPLFMYIGILDGCVNTQLFMFINIICWFICRNSCTGTYRYLHVCIDVCTFLKYVCPNHLLGEM